MKHIYRAGSVLAAACLIFSLGFFAGSTLPTLQTQAQQPAETETLFEPFWETWGFLKQRYLHIEDFTDEQLMEAALNGMVNVLGDENTAYMNPQLYSELTNRMSGEYEGIGATVRRDEATGGVLIVSTTEGSPAREMLRQGDIVLAVNGKDITGLSLTEAVQLIRGPSGTFVELKVMRKGTSEPLQLKVQRARIRQEIVSYRLFEGGIGYVSIASFADNVPADLEKALTALNANQLNGLILDMRNDPGGGLQTAIDVASFFLEGGVIVRQQGREETDEIVYRASRDALAPDVPMVVLLNQASASASELVAGALQDRGRAKVVGTLSFGKGSIQQWLRLGNGGGLRVTIAQFFKPSGGIINHVGIIPDLYVPWTEDQARDNPDYDPQLTEAIWQLLGKM